MNVVYEIDWRIDDLIIETGMKFERVTSDKGFWLEREGQQMSPTFATNKDLLDYVDGVLQGVRLGKASHLGDT